MSRAAAYINTMPEGSSTRNRASAAFALAQAIALSMAQREPRESKFVMFTNQQLQRAFDVLRHYNVETVTDHECLEPAIKMLAWAFIQTANGFGENIERDIKLVFIEGDHYNVIHEDTLHRALTCIREGAKSIVAGIPELAGVMHPESTV